MWLLFVPTCRNYTRIPSKLNWFQPSKTTRSAEQPWEVGEPQRNMKLHQDERADFLPASLCIAIRSLFIPLAAVLYFVALLSMTARDIVKPIFIRFVKFPHLTIQTSNRPLFVLKNYQQRIQCPKGSAPKFLKGKKTNTRDILRYPRAIFGMDFFSFFLLCARWYDVSARNNRFPSSTTRLRNYCSTTFRANIQNSPYWKNFIT